MMQRTTTLSALMALLLITGCGTTASEPMADAANDTVVRTVKEVAISSGTPVTTAELTITGMSCEMMCGGAIRKALGQLPGVTHTEIDFNEGEEADMAIVTYDEAHVSDVDLVKAVEGLYNGQYKVTGVVITKQVRATSAQGDDADRAQHSNLRKLPVLPVRGTAGPAALPSVMALLTRVLRH